MSQASNGQPCARVVRLVIAFFTGDSAADDERRAKPDSTDGPTAAATGTDAVHVEIDGETHRLSAAEAIGLRDALGTAVATSETFLHTAFERRPDGEYALFRRGDDRPAKVFDSRARLRSVYRELPEEFTASDVTAVSGSRRHLLVRHFVEHPAFDCRLTCRNPLTASKE